MSDNTRNFGTVTNEIRSPNFIEVYANHSKQRITPYDISLTFAALRNPPNADPRVEELCSVTLSPQHFKTFVAGLNDTLKAYESHFGEINALPPAILQRNMESYLRSALDALNKDKPTSE